MKETSVPCTAATTLSVAVSRLRTAPAISVSIASSTIGERPGASIAIFSGEVDADDLVAQLREAAARDDTDIADPKYRNTHAQVTFAVDERLIAQIRSEGHRFPVNTI